MMRNKFIFESRKSQPVVALKNFIIGVPWFSSLWGVYFKVEVTKLWGVRENGSIVGDFGKEMNADLKVN